MMERGSILWLVLLGVSIICAPCAAEIVELLLSCEGQYGLEQLWATEFDLGITFTEISNAYIDWSGTITAELIGADPPFPINGQFVARLYESDPHDYMGAAFVRAGVATYPDPEPFDLQSSFINWSWSMLLDGQGRIEIWFGGIARPEIWDTVEPPSGMLDSATLVFNGTPVPEPATVILFALGGLMLRRRG